MDTILFGCTWNELVILRDFARQTIRAVRYLGLDTWISREQLEPANNVREPYILAIIRHSWCEHQPLFAPHCQLLSDWLTKCVLNILRWRWWCSAYHWTCQARACKWKHFSANAPSCWNTLLYCPRRVWAKRMRLSIVEPSCLQEHIINILSAPFDKANWTWTIIGQGIARVWVCALLYWCSTRPNQMNS